MPELAILVPTRGRPENIRKVISAWDFTNAWDVADLVLIVDRDDPELYGYQALQEETRNPDSGEPIVHLTYMDEWMPMVYKLNYTAVRAAEHYWALGFAGDDHLPRTINWAKRYLAVLHELGTGMVYGDDGYQGSKLSTEWAVTADAVRTLGQMVPADVEHMYCDNSMLDLFTAAGAVRHLPEVRIEHMHPIVGKAETDEQYQRVNHRDQFKKDKAAYEAWRHGDIFLKDVAEIRHLRPGAIESRPPAEARRIRPGSTPMRVPARKGSKTVERSGPSTQRRISSVFPRHFRQVVGATPEEIGVTLADFAAQVPADQEIVELGVFQGKTALQMAWGASFGHGAHVTAIDPWDLPGNVYDPPFTDSESRGWAHHNVAWLGYQDRIALIHDFSRNVAEVWGPENGLKPVGLLYVDGDHTKEGAKRDIESWAPHLAPGARIAVDDYGHADWPGVAQAVDELVAVGFLEPVEIYHDRLAVTRLAAVAENPEVKDSPVTAITSEGVSPSPVPDDVDALFDIPQEAPVVDTEESKMVVSLEDALFIKPASPVGTSVTTLNLSQLKSLARHRGIRLGIRKDKRDLIIQAIREGR